MTKLLSTPDFNGLPHLQKLALEGCYELEEIHPSFGSHKSLKYLNISNCPKLRMFPTIVHMRNLKTLTQRECHELEEMHPSFGSYTSLEYLNISACRKLRMFPTIAPMRNLKTLKIKGCSLKDGEIPSGIGELSNLKELDLSFNDFSLLDFTISQLPCLKVLKLSKCFMLNELPDLPSSLVFLNANQWMPFTTNLANDGERILQSMLEGEAIENGSMILLLPGLKIPMGFTPPLLRSKTYTLQLPENWRDDFSGFLMCVVLNYVIFSRGAFKITVKQALSGVSFEDDLVWEESDGEWNTLVWYVSFGLFRDSAWWNQTYKALFETTTGEAIKNGSMVLLLQGLKIPMGFTPPPLRRKRYTLQLPENWRDGFLMCAVPNKLLILKGDFKIIVKQALSGDGFEDDLVWEESDGEWNTLVWYVSFRDSAWWNQTYKALYFEITTGECSGFGVRLVAKKN
ncbi:hypothetical protein R6Q57_002200 [Mikania cordata]